MTKTTEQHWTLAFDIKIKNKNKKEMKEKDLYLKAPQYSPCIVLFTHQKVDTEYLVEQSPKILMSNVCHSKPGKNDLNIQFELSLKNKVVKKNKIVKKNK